MREILRRLSDRHAGLATRLAATAAVAGTVVIGGITGLGTPQAFAHDSVIGGTVEAGQSLNEFPHEITLEFSAIPKEGFNTFAVTNTETNEVLFDAEPTIDGRNLTIDVPAGVEPGPGNYQVGFQITSSDGHATRGSVPFTVAGGAPADAAANPSDAATDGAKFGPADSRDDGQLPVENLPAAAKWAIGAGGILAGLAVIIVVAAKMRGTGSKG